jgi:hypothetical protein
MTPFMFPSCCFKAFLIETTGMPVPYDEMNGRAVQSFLSGQVPETAASVCAADVNPVKLFLILHPITLHCSCPLAEMPV